MPPQARTPRKTVEEFLAWAEGRRGRYELMGGEVVSQSAERAAHLKVKLATHVALLTAIRAKGLPCHVLPDGAAVRIDDETVYEPDGLVYCGPEAPASALLFQDPMIIVEIFRPRRVGSIRDASLRIISAWPASPIISSSIPTRPSSSTTSATAPTF